jgi:hypothetical protein
MKRIFVVGTARDCASTLENDVLRVTNAFGNKFELHWLIVESDSSDNSIEILESLKSRIGNFNYKSLSNLSHLYSERTERLAICRNEYLKEIRDLDQSFEFVVVMDFDGINSMLTSQSIESCWAIKDWTVQTANQAGPYFDIWALRHNSWCPNDWITDFNVLREQGMKTSKALRIILYRKMVTIPPKSDPIEVDSAFGGFAIYRKECLSAGTYIGMVEGKPVCEHVSLHKSIRESGGRILINPGLINAGFTSHTFILRPSVRAKTFIKGLLGKVQQR